MYWVSLKKKTTLMSNLNKAWQRYLTLSWCLALSCLPSQQSDHARDPASTAVHCDVGSRDVVKMNPEHEALKLIHVSPVLTSSVTSDAINQHL